MHNRILSIDFISFSFAYFCPVFWLSNVFVCLVLFCCPVLFLRLVLYYLRLHPLFLTHWHTFVSLWPTFTTPGFHHSRWAASLSSSALFISRSDPFVPNTCFADIQPYYYFHHWLPHCYANVEWNNFHMVFLGLNAGYIFIVTYNSLLLYFN